MQHFLEAAFSVFGVLSFIARVVSMISNFIKLKKFIDKERQVLLRNHVFRRHQQPIKYCKEESCAAL